MAIFADGTIITTEGNGAYLDTLIQTGKTLTNNAGGSIAGATLHTPRHLAAYEHSDGTTGAVGVKSTRGLPVVYQSATETLAQETVGTTSAAFAAIASLTEGVHVKALASNTGQVYLKKGATATTGNGWELSAKDEVFIRCGNANEINAIASAAGQKVCVKAW
ncbi:MAG: hypothetical protein VKJ06_01625 [Vampirovibrionales bacterium]|nr:hypothetical protein [Vampirovibrionales bacterium]